MPIFSLIFGPSPINSLNINPRDWYGYYIMPGGYWMRVRDGPCKVKVIVVGSRVAVKSAFGEEDRKGLRIFEREVL
jgi:hypothetical protein